MSEASSRITAGSTRLSSENLTQLQTTYLTETPYTRARSETRLAVGSLLAELPAHVASAAQTLWGQCTSPAVVEGALPSSPRSFPFSGGARYIDPRILNCINEGFENTKRDLLPQGEALGEFLRSDGAENYVFREWVDPALLSDLDRLLDGAIRSQEGSLASWRTTAGAALRTEVTRDSTWLHSAPLRDRALVRCRAHLETFALPQLLGGASFFSIDEEKGTLIDTICSETIDSPQSRATINEARSRLTRALPSLQTELERALSETRRACGAEPRACIEARWNSLVENARAQWAVHALAAEFAGDEALVQSLSRRILNDRF